jgi:hypothetical protein
MANAMFAQVSLGSPKVLLCNQVLLQNLPLTLPNLSLETKIHCSLGVVYT